MERTERDAATLEEVLCEYPELREELEPLLKLAQDLRALPKVRAPESLRTSRRPVFASRDARAGSSISRWRLYPIDRLAAAPWGAALPRLAAAIALTFILLGGVATVSAGSLPDEPLYPVKLAIEDLQLAVAPSPQAQMELELHFTARRLEEVETAVLQGRVESAQRGLALYEERVAKLHIQTEPASTVTDSIDPERLKAGLERQQEVLNRVLHKLPEQAQPAALRAMEASKQPRGGVGRPANELKGGAIKPEGAVETPQIPAATATPEMLLITPTDGDRGGQGKAKGNAASKERGNNQDGERKSDERERPARGGSSPESRSEEKRRTEEKQLPTQAPAPATPTATVVSLAPMPQATRAVPAKDGARAPGQPDYQREQMDVAPPATAKATPEPRGKRRNGVGPNP